MPYRLRSAVRAALLVFLFSVLSALHVAAQQSVTLLSPVDGELTSARPVQTWAFSTGLNTVVSIYVEATAESLDPTVRVLDQSGAEVIANDDAAYPTALNALLEAITLPRPGQYQIVVSGYGGSLGTYRLTVSPGYAALSVQEAFGTVDDWEAASDDLDVSATGGQMTLALDGIGLRGAALLQERSSPADFYAQVRVVTVTSRNPWYTGLVMRRQGERYYLVEVDSRGQWRFLFYDLGEAAILRDWATHPAITPGQTAFTLAVMAHGRGLSLFYNGLLLGRISDAAITGAGQLGIYAATENALNSQVRVQVDDLVVTQPLEIDGAAVFPTEILRSDDTLTIQELERRRIIPTDGQLVFNVPESFVDSARQGVAQTGLGRGAAFRSFVLATTVTLTKSADAGTAGCALLFGGQDDETYSLAYLDSTGAVGVSRRAGSSFAPGLYREGTGWSALDANRLLVIVLADRLLFFVNGRYEGALEQAAVEGTVGNALINYDLLETTCEFRDTWLWGLN